MGHGDGACACGSCDNWVTFREKSSLSQKYRKGNRKNQTEGLHLVLVHFRFSLIIFHLLVDFCI